MSAKPVPRELLLVERARWWAMTKQPFYGSLAMRLHDVVDRSIETAQTDGRVIRWNPDWLATLTEPEVRFVLLHEAMHCAHLHMWRLPATKEGNDAGDYAINLVLQDIDGTTMPADGLLDAQYKGMAEEEILKARRKPPMPQGGGGNDKPDGGDGPDEQQPEQPGDDGSIPAGDGAPDPQGPDDGDGKPDNCGGFGPPAAPKDADPVTEAKAQKDLRDEWEEAVIQAGQAAQALGQGNLPADLERELERMRVQRIDWRMELAEFIRSAVGCRNDWSRASRRHAWGPVLMPKRRPDDLGLIIAGVDTSGSVHAKAPEFLALVQQCADETGARVLVIQCDARIKAEQMVEVGEEVKLRAKGGGGTDFRPVFERADQLVAEEGERIAGIVYITDLYGTEPETTDHPTLWLSINDKVAQTGRTIRIPE